MPSSLTIAGDVRLALKATEAASEIENAMDNDYVHSMARVTRVREFTAKSETSRHRSTRSTTSPAPGDLGGGCFPGNAGDVPRRSIGSDHASPDFERRFAIRSVGIAVTNQEIFVITNPPLADPGRFFLDIWDAP